MSTPTAVAAPTKHPPKLSPKLITGEELYAVGDIGPSELVKGEIKYLWSEVQKKLAEYFAVDVLMVGVVDPQLEQIHVYRSLEQMKLLRKEDTLVGDDVLPGFQVALTEILTAQ